MWALRSSVAKDQSSEADAHLGLSSVRAETTFSSVNRLANVISSVEDPRHEGTPLIDEGAFDPSLLLTGRLFATSQIDQALRPNQPQPSTPDTRTSLLILTAPPPICASLLTFGVTTLPVLLLRSTGAPVASLDSMTCELSASPRPAQETYHLKDGVTST
jgi:hypothetical protein